MFVRDCLGTSAMSNLYTDRKALRHRSCSGLFSYFGLLYKSFKSTHCTPHPAANSNQTAAGLTEAETTKGAQMNSDKAQPIAEFHTQLVTAAQEKRISYGATTGLKGTTNSIPTTYDQLTASPIM